MLGNPIDYDKKYEAEEKEDEKNAKEFIEQNKGKFFFYFSYAFHFPTN